MYINRYPDKGGELIMLHSAAEQKLLNLLKEIICANINQQHINELISSGDEKKMDMLPFKEDRAALLLREIQQYEQAFHSAP